MTTNAITSSTQQAPLPTSKSTPTNTETQPTSESQTEALDVQQLATQHHSALIQTILSRHTTRLFRPTPVPLPMLHQCLSLAQHSPSSTNFQPWRLTFTSGARLDRLRSVMTQAALSGQPSTVPPTPEQFRKYRSEVGHAVYGPQGWDVPRADKEAYRKAQLKNYDFFGAPLVAVVGIDESLMVGGADVLSVGLYVQTLVLLLTERGLGTCIEVSTSGYADVLRRELGIGENIVVLCTLGIGYEDPSHSINTVRVKRDEWKDHVDFVLD